MENSGPKLTKVEQEKIDLAKEYLANARNFIVNSQQNYLHAAHELKIIKAKKLEFDVMRKKLKAPILEAAKGIENFFREPIAFLSEAESIYKTGMVKYNEVEEKKVLQKAIEYRQEQERLSREALEALEQGNEERFEELNSNIINLPETPEITKIEGISYRDNWKGKVTDLSKLIMAIATGHAPESLIKIDESALNQLARSTKGTISYPGIIFCNDKVVVSK